jgi:glycosyltransferase involved in cell wall biosynthesis
VAHLVSHPIQYFAPLYRELGRRDDFDFTVYFYSDATLHRYSDAGFDQDVKWDVPLLDGYKAVFCPSARTTTHDGSLIRRRNLDVVREVVRGGYDAIWAHGYAHLTTWLAFAATRARRTPFLIREEQTLLRPRSVVRRTLKRVPLRAMFSSSYGLYIGSENRRYLRHYGVRDERLFSAPYCVDNDSLRAAAADAKPTRAATRFQYGFHPGDVVLLFVGKLIPQKNLVTLFNSFTLVTDRVKLLVVGDGPLRSNLAELARSHGLEQRIVFTGFINQSQLPHIYGAADLFVLPSSSETWGLVVNEALNFGLPVVVSDRVGCGKDLVIPGRNGFIVPYEDHAALAQVLNRLANDTAFRQSLGAEGLCIVDDYSLKACADGIVEAVGTACERRWRA